MENRDWDQCRIAVAAKEISGIDETGGGGGGPKGIKRVLRSILFIVKKVN